MIMMTMMMISTINQGHSYHIKIIKVIATIYHYAKVLP